MLPVPFMTLLITVDCGMFLNHHRPVHPQAQGLPLDAQPIQPGSILFLKGAGRIHTAIAVLIYCYRNSITVFWLEVYVVLFNLFELRGISAPIPFEGA